mgnify:CR=1 FL=1
MVKQYKEETLLRTCNCDFTGQWRPSAILETMQEVEIYFKFIGKYVPPHFGEMKLTPEEAEALRKREERKDKLHQAYLRRKASGAQKKYEDKVRAKKKAEREAKSAALRADGYRKGHILSRQSVAHVGTPESNGPKPLCNLRKHHQEE